MSTSVKRQPSDLDRRSVLPGVRTAQRTARAERWDTLSYLFLLLACGLLLAVGGCAKTVVRPQMESAAARGSRPEQVIVYNFAISEDEVKEGQGLLAAKNLSVDTEAEREQAIGANVADVLARDLASGLLELGMPTRRAKRGTTIPENALLVDGYFVNVDEGNRARRLVIGFGAGASKVDTQVRVYQATGTGRRKLLEFSTHADSGKMPGAAVTLGAGAAAQGGVTAGAAVANVAVAGVKTYRSEVERMAGKSAEQAVAYLSEYFAKQGWIRPDQAKKAKQAK